MKVAGVAAIICVYCLPLHALELSQCDRVTHVSHGGQDMHEDLGEGRVMWRDWWSQEGTAADFTVMDCDAGAALMFRTAEENMGNGTPFDRTDDALEVVRRHESGARVFATLARMAEDLRPIARGITIRKQEQESCACAALYAELRGQKRAFLLDQ